MEKEDEVTNVTKADWKTVTSKKKKKKQNPANSSQSSNQKPVTKQHSYSLYRPPVVYQQPIGYPESYLPPRVYQHPGSYQYYSVPPQPSFNQLGYPVQGGSADMRLLPTPLMNLPVRQPENSSFYWGIPNNQYRKYQNLM